MTISRLATIIILLAALATVASCATIKGAADCLTRGTNACGFN